MGGGSSQGVYLGNMYCCISSRMQAFTQVTFRVPAHESNTMVPKFHGSKILDQYFNHTAKHQGFSVDDHAKQKNFPPITRAPSDEATFDATSAIPKRVGYPL